MKKIRLYVITSQDKERIECLDNFEIVERIVFSDAFNTELIIHTLALMEINAFLVSQGLYSEQPELIDKLKLTGLPVLKDGEQVFFAERKISLFLKRVVDVIAAMIGLILVALASVIIFPIIQIQSPGNIIFSQERVGKNGKHFKMYKFRSMYLDAEERKRDLLKYNEISSDLMFKLENDPRIFPFGQKLRNWSIDELPQFINVLKGEMSLIGTRPPTAEEVSKYKLHHFKRLTIKPGITGMWQISGRSNIQDFEQVVALDSEYIDNWSLWLDFKIILKTIKVVLKREGSK